MGQFCKWLHEQSFALSNWYSRWSHKSPKCPLHNCSALVVGWRRPHTAMDFGFVLFLASMSNLRYRQLYKSLHWVLSSSIWCSNKSLLDSYPWLSYRKFGKYSWTLPIMVLRNRHYSLAGSSEWLRCPHQNHWPTKLVEHWRSHPVEVWLLPCGIHFGHRPS